MAKRDKKKTLLNLYSALLGRAQLASKLGQQYGGDRDVYEALGYKTTLTYNDYAARYDRQDIARAIIDRPVTYTWKGAVLVSEADSGDQTDLERIWMEMEKQLALKSRFIRVDKLSSIGQYGVLLLGFNDISGNDGFSEPVEKKKTLKLLYTKPLSEKHAAINEYDFDPKSPRYGRPKNYKVSYGEGDSTESADLVVHHSRIIHVVGHMLESDVLGTPVLQPVYNRLMDLEKLVGASAEMFWRGARPGVQAIADKDYNVFTEVLDDLQDQYDEFENNLRRVFTLEGLKMENLEQQVADPKGHVDIQLQMISAITGIPQRVLTGSERGELASTQDLTGWYTLIQTRRVEYVEQVILRPFIDRMIELGIFPEPKGGMYAIEWQDLFSASDKDKAEVGKIRATAIKEYVQNPMAEMIIPPEAFMEYMLGLDEDQIDQIQSMASEAIAEEQANGGAPETPDPEDEENDEDNV